MRGCTRARRAIPLALDGELALSERFRLDAHLERCSRCRALWEEQETLEQALADLPEAPLDRLDLDVQVAAVRAGIERAREEDAHGDGLPERPSLPPVRRAPSRRRAMGLAAAAVMLAGAWVLWQLRTSPPAPAPVDRIVSAPEPESTEPTPPQPSAEGLDAQPTVDDDGDVVLSRLRQARAHVAAELRVAWTGLEALAPRDEVEAAAQAFDAATLELEPDWPLLRIVQGLAVGEDRDLGAAALRYLGVRGDGIAAGVLRDALGEADLGLVAVAALGDLGSAGLDALGEALVDVDLGPAARDALLAHGGQEAVAVLAEVLGQQLRRGEPADELLELLATVEPSAAPELLNLVQRGLVSRGQALDLLARSPGAGEALMDRLEAGESRWSEALVFEALAVLRPAEGLAWIEERVTVRRLREPALACLASYADPDALQVLVRLHANGRVRGDLVEGAARDLLTRDPRAAVDLARRRPPELDDDPAALYQLLVATESAAAVPGLAALVYEPWLGSESRAWAALAVGELGTPDAARDLIEGLPRLGGGEEFIAAACLMAATQLAGPDLALRAVDAVGVADRSRERLMDQLADVSEQGLRVKTLHRVARELKPYYDPKTAKRGPEAL